MADMDKLKEKIAEAIYPPTVMTTEFEAVPFNEAMERPRHYGLRHRVLKAAEAVLTAIESAGYVIMPKDQILRKMTKDEFSELMAGIPFRENDLGCQAKSSTQGETVSAPAEPLQSGLGAETFEEWQSLMRKAINVQNGIASEEERQIVAESLLRRLDREGFQRITSFLQEASSQGSIQEAQRADTESAASDGVCLTPHKINQESDNG
jgi:hypothetical protein